MTDNPYRAPSVASIKKPHPVVLTRRWLSDSGLLALSVICGGVASVIVFGGQYFDTNRNLFGFGGLGLFVVSVSGVSVRRGLRDPRATGWLTCVQTCLAGILPFVVGVPMQMSRSFSRSDGKLLVIVSGLLIILSLALLFVIRSLRRKY